jgi:hypothetical protein
MQSKSLIDCSANQKTRRDGIASNLDRHVDLRRNALANHREGNKWISVPVQITIALCFRLSSGS